MLVWLTMLAQANPRCVSCVHEPLCGTYRASALQILWWVQRIRPASKSTSTRCCSTRPCSDSDISYPGYIPCDEILEIIQLLCLESLLHFNHLLFISIRQILRARRRGVQSLSSSRNSSSTWPELFADGRAEETRLNFVDLETSMMEFLAEDSNKYVLEW